MTDKSDKDTKSPASANVQSPSSTSNVSSTGANAPTATQPVVDTNAPVLPAWYAALANDKDSNPQQLMFRHTPEDKLGVYEATFLGEGSNGEGFINLSCNAGTFENVTYEPSGRTAGKFFFKPLQTLTPLQQQLEGKAVDIQHVTSPKA